MRYLGVDVETFLIKPGVLAPRLVCMSVAEEGQPTALYDAVTACLVFRRLLRDPDVTIVGHNVAYDMLVLTLSADTMADTFAAYDANRIADTKIRQELLDIAAGRTAGTGGYNMVFRDGQYVKAGYSLADLEKLHLGIDRSAEKHNEDAWRFKYDSLVDIPVSAWPAEAVKYAKADADNTLRVYKAQGARVPDEEEQVRAAWALHLTAWRGMRVDPNRVAALDERMAALRQANRRRLIQAGLLKPKKMMPAQIREGKKPDFEEGGKPYVYSKDMARIKEYTARVYRRQALPVPMTDKGAVCTDKDSLVESGSRLLATLAEGGGVDKIINTYMPVLKAGLEAPINTRYNALVNSGRASSSAPNLQNCPSGRRVGGVRECFVPAPGNALISVDYETLELRTLAQCLLWLFKESRMALALNSGRDLHLEVAAQIVKCSYEEALAKHKNKDKDVKKARDVAKCFHPDTEVLTRSGWKRIEMLDSSEEVAAVIPQAAGGLEVVWQLPVAYQRIEASAGLIRLSNESVDIRVTPDHRMLAFNLGGRAITTTPEAFSSARAWWSAGELDEGLDIPETTLRLIAATQADGSYERNVNGGVRAIKFGFSKTRKIERLEAIFKEAGIEYRTGIYPNGKHKPTTFFKIKGAIVADIVKWIPEKEFTYNLLTLSLKSRKILIEESRFWDGSTPPNGTGFSVCSVSKGCLEALQAACAISGYKATFTHNIYKANPKHKTAYSLSIKLRNYSRGGNVKAEQIAYTGPVVCLTVPADAILVRDAGKVIACHQCANFGYPGGLGSDSFVAFARKSYGLKLKPDEAKNIKKAWQKAWPEMKPYFDYISRITESEDNKLKQLGTERVRGRLRFTEAANTLFQGLAGSGAKRALYETCKRAYAGDLPGLYPVAFIHDEILAEAPVDKVHEYGYALADTMISAMQKYVPDVKITASPVAMDVWSKSAYEKFDDSGRLQIWRYSEDKKSD